MHWLEQASQMFEMHIGTHLKSPDPGSRMSNARTCFQNQIPLEYEITLKDDFDLSGVKVNNWICSYSLIHAAMNNMES